MRFTIDGISHEWDEQTITFGEGEAIEDATGLSFPEVGISILRGSLKAQRAFVWIAMKRTSPELKFADLADWRIDSVVWSFEDEDEDESDSKDGVVDPKKDLKPKSPLSKVEN